MTYLFAQYWIFIAFAFLLGMFVGWATCNGADGGRARASWLGWAIAIFLGGVFLALFRVVPGLAGHLLEVLLLLFAAYIIGCAFGCGGRWALEESEGSSNAHDRAEPRLSGDSAAASAISTAAGAAALAHREVFGVDSSASYPGLRPDALAAARDGKPDDLTAIAGVDAGTAKALGDIGVFHHDQIAAWGAPQSQWVEHHLGQAGRVDREDWVAQAGRLAVAAPAAVAAGVSVGASKRDQSPSMDAAVASAAPVTTVGAETPPTASASAGEAVAEPASNGPAESAASAPSAAATSEPMDVSIPSTAPLAAMTDGARSLAAQAKRAAASAPEAPDAPATKDASATPAAPAGAVRPPAGSLSDAPADDLKLIKGVGPANEAALNALGIRRFTQIADWTPANAQWIGHHIDFPGRVEREHWVNQARLLAAGIETPHSAAAKSGATAIDEGADAPMSEAQAHALGQSLPGLAEKVDDEHAYAGVRPLGLAAAHGGKVDDLKLIKGVGKQNQERLHALGVWHFDQIAAWTPDNVMWIGSYLAFPGRIDREDWIAQAIHLARGEETEFSKRVEAGDVPTSKG